MRVSGCRLAVWRRCLVGQYLVISNNMATRGHGGVLGHLVEGEPGGEGGWCGGLWPPNLQSSTPKCPRFRHAQGNKITTDPVAAPGELPSSHQAAPGASCWDAISVTIHDTRLAHPPWPP